MTKPVSELTFDQAVDSLQALADPAVRATQAHFGSHPGRALGISMPKLHHLADHHRDHPLALQLWQTGIHEARLLACMVDDPYQVTLDQMESWVNDFDSWDICDGVCGTLFDRTPWAVERALAWSERQEEYVRRAGFVLMAELAVHNKNMSDEAFMQFFPVMLRHATDGRNFVRKAVNWALRQIGKRSPFLLNAASETARQMHAIDSPSARWIASDALREFAAKSAKLDESRK
ncbi:MAG: DNA alkylation repair protein [Anaerolineaceae bacterium]|nr:DNA alkylation repair protein [Anaerolineaceae bacterium]